MRGPDWQAQDSGYSEHRRSRHEATWDACRGDHDASRQCAQSRGKSAHGGIQRHGVGGHLARRGVHDHRLARGGVEHRGAAGREREHHEGDNAVSRKCCKPGQAERWKQREQADDQQQAPAAALVGQGAGGQAEQQVRQHARGKDEPDGECAALAAERQPGDRRELHASAQGHRDAGGQKPAKARGPKSAQSEPRPK